MEGLGKFMELEVVLRPDQSDEEGQAIALDLMSKLGVEETDLLEGAYMDLMENDEKNARNQKADNSQAGR